ncbi:ATP-binding protein [Eubacterium oxidoreducens]|uniref:MoxR-like ATPase n=1 Tax=Eubacterium oxidoreducens TaxID=1732 RepID=A0A1G6BNI4_EUBOX|nr:MoxR family ATPase [Eubacterium oxidoreducens]SDB22139.1 MoxR-like ATPase [Eubacterium oxidoreducens]
MNIKEAKEQIKNAILAYITKDEFGQYKIPIERQRPVFLIGAPGIGKTAVMEQIAQEMNLGLVSYSMTHHTRQSALGLPFIKKEEYEGQEYRISEYTMSEILASVYKLKKETGYEEGILFLDEINCVSETLAPSMLQFLQYKTFGTHHLPQGWIVVTAGNPPEYNRSVREYDIVTWDRLKRIDVEPDFDAWKEYAYKKGIHGAIMSFLEIKKQFFYVVEVTAEKKEFVTARGWEDLSEMMKLYEENAIDIDLKLMEQYIQNPQIAKEFSIYYDLYRKYQSDYQIQDILAGCEGEDIRTRAARAALDERLSLLGLLLDTVDQSMKEFMIKDAAILENLRILKFIKANLSTEFTSYTEILGNYIKEEDKKLSIGKRAGSLSKEAEYAGLYTVQFLEKMQAELKARRVSNNKEAFAYIKSSYDQEVEEHKIKINRIKDNLTHLFAFVEKVYGRDHEMLIVVSELTVRYYCSQFISKCGCEEYFKNNDELMFYEKRQQLLEQIDELGQ